MHGIKEDFRAIRLPYSQGPIKIISIPYIPKNKAIINNNTSMLSCLKPNGLLRI